MSEGTTLSQSASSVKRLFRSHVRSRDQVAPMSHSVDAYDLARSCQPALPVAILSFERRLPVAVELRVWLS